MSCRLTFHNAAERELTDAAAYYDNSRPGLGNSFIECLENRGEGEAPCRTVVRWYGAGPKGRHRGLCGAMPDSASDLRIAHPEGWHRPVLSGYNLLGSFAACPY